MLRNTRPLSTPKNILAPIEMNAQPDNIIALRIPGEAQYLFLIRTVITALARDAGLPELDVDKIEVAVDEACTNVLDHAYRHHAPKPPIDIEIQITEDRFLVDVIDYGQPFEFSNYVPPRFPDHWLDGQTRGVGLYLIHQCMEKVECQKLGPSRNRLRLVKYRQTSADQQPAGARG